MNGIRIATAALFALAAALASARGGEIALTFDDAPLGDSQYYTGYKRTKLLIRKLEKAGIDEVAFFVTTKHLSDELAERRLRLYAEAGHVIGNHTHSHERIHRLGVDTYIGDIRSAHQKLKDLPGFKPWFRFPFLDEGRDQETREKIRAALQEMGYRHGYVTVDNYEWYLNQKFQQALMRNRRYDIAALRDAYVDLIWESIAFYDDIAKKTLGRSPKHVLLLHENDLTAMCLQDLVERIRAEGWTIISPTEAYRDPIAEIHPATVNNNQGRVAAIAEARGYTASLRHKSEDRDWMDQHLRKNGIIFRAPMNPYIK